MVYLDNQYLDDKRSEGLLPKLDQLAEEADDPVKALATSKAYFASQRCAIVCQQIAGRMKRNRSERS